MQLAPGVLTGVGGASGLLGYTSGRGTNGAVINGAPVEDVTYIIDGINSVDTDAGVLIFFPPVDSIQEFKVQTSSAPAAFGGGQGIINVIYKSGTNQLHGAAYEFLRNSAFDAKNFFDSADQPHPAIQAEPVRLQCGRSRGAAEDVQRQGQAVLLRRLRRQARAPGADVPEHGSDAGVPDRRLLRLLPRTVVLDPRSNPRFRCPAMSMPASAIDPVSAKMVGAVSRSPTCRARSTTSCYNPVQTNRVDQFNIRSDYRTSRSAIFGRFSYEDADTFNPGNLPEPAIGAGPGRPGQVVVPSKQAVFGYGRSLGRYEVLRPARRLLAHVPGHLRLGHEVRRDRGAAGHSERECGRRGARVEHDEYHRHDRPRRRRRQPAEGEQQLGDRPGIQLGHGTAMS